MPNSLIFAVILAVWAAYLIQHWIRRRDHVATARSVDRFSEAMRVLERRQSAPRADLTAPTPRSYSVSLTRPAHPDVVVKRARPGAAGPDPRRARRRLPRPSVATLRALLLVLGVLGLGAGVTVWALGLAPWWAAAAGAAALLLALTGVRLSVGRQRRQAASPVRASRPGTARQAARPRPARMAPPSGARRSRAVRPTRRRPAARRAAARSAPAARQTGERTGTGPSPSRQVAQHAPRDEYAAIDQHAVLDQQTQSVEPAAQVAAAQFFDVEAHDPAPAVATGSASGAAGTASSVSDTAHPVAVGDPAEFKPGTWAPVPVPPPTYTLKARATRPGAPAPDSAEAVPGVVSDADRRARSAHRIEDLPFDGHALAFDEEFEDLPPVHSVG